MSLLLRTMFQKESATRKELMVHSGLSKATVSRLTDELLESEMLVLGPIGTDPGTRGRRAELLSVASTLGLVVGVNLGVQTTSIAVRDLAGRDLGWSQLPTRKWSSLDEAVDWLASVIEDATASQTAPLLQAAIAVPARVIDEVEIRRPPLFMSTIEGRAFGDELSRRLGGEVCFASDAAMMLTGFGTTDLVAASETPVLLNLSSVLTMSLRRRDGSIAAGRTTAFGDFSILTVGTELGEHAIGTLLSAHGLYELAARVGNPLVTMAELWESESTPVLRIRDSFARALLEALRIIAVMSDPETVLITGRLTPLVRLVLPEVRNALATELDTPPAIRLVGDDEGGYPISTGAVTVGLSKTVDRICGRVAEGGIGALSQAR